MRMYRSLITVVYDLSLGVVGEVSPMLLDTS